jgi:hypothetical protein
LRFRICVGVSILCKRVAEKWWRVGISTNRFRDDGIAVRVDMLAFIFCIPGPIVGEDHWVDRNAILFVCRLEKLLPALVRAGYTG